MKVFQSPTGNSSEDEQNSKRHARRYRVYFIILAVWIAFLVILATILTPMLVLQHEDTAAEKAYRAEENDLANNFTTEFRDAVLNAISAVYGVQGYIMGEMKTLPNLTASKEDRVAGQYFPSFDRYAKLVNSSATSIAVFLTAPGGVTYQFFPEKFGASLSDWDLLDEAQYGPPGNWSDPAAQRPTSWTSIQTGRLAITGPYNTSSLPFVEHYKQRTTVPPSDAGGGRKGSGGGAGRPTTTLDPASGGAAEQNEAWWIDLRQPVYKATANVQISHSTFWGFAMAAVSVDDLLQRNAFEATMHAHKMNYTVYTNTSAKDCVVIVSSWPGVHDCTLPFMKDFINAATVHDVLGDHLAWKVAVKSALRENRLTSHVRVAIVLSSVLGTLGFFALMVYVIILCTRVYDGAVHAPKMAPFAMLTVGPCRGEELWELASDQMVDVKERLGRVLAKQMVRHHAYQIQQVHPLTTSYVTRSVAAAVQMAFDAIEELQSAPIDEPLRHLLGDDCGLLLSYAVHWCNDAVVRPEHLEGGYRYEGPDVVYGGRMWVFSAPNVVTVSPTALPAAKRIPHAQTKLFDSVFLRGVSERQDLYVLSDPSNRRLCEAEAFAAEQVRRARQAQREMTEMQGSDADPRKRRLTFAFNPTGYDSSDLDLGSFSGRQRMNGSGGVGGGGAVAVAVAAAAAAAVVRGGGNTHAHSSSSTSDHSTPSSGLRSRAMTANAARVAAGGKRDGVVGIAAAPTAVMVPSSAAESSLPGGGGGLGPMGGVPNPLLVPCSKTQERVMVRRPSGWESTSNDASASGSDSENDKEAEDEARHRNSNSDASPGNKMMEAFVQSSAGVVHEDEDEGDEGLHQEPRQPPTLTARLQQSHVPYGVCVPPLLALPPICASQRPAAGLSTTVVVAGVGAGATSSSATATTASSGNAAPLPGMSSRRVLDTLYRSAVVTTSANATNTVSATSTPTSTNTTTSSSFAALGTGQRHGESATAKPLVMVPPSAELAAAASSSGGVGGTVHGVPSKCSSGTPSSDSTGHMRRLAGGPASSSYDNPLAHNLAGGPSSGANGGSNGAADGSPLGDSNVASPPLIAMTSFASDRDPLADSRVSLDTFSSDLLLRPAITVQADHLLRTVFDRQAVALDVSYDSVRVLVYYFYSSYKILFRPLAAPERHNIYRRLMTAFGVPQQGILEHLAARCAIRFLQRHEEMQTLLWDQQRRLQVHGMSHSAATTTTASTSDDAGHSQST